MPKAQSTRDENSGTTNDSASKGATNALSHEKGPRRKDDPPGDPNQPDPKWATGSMEMEKAK